MGFEWSLDGYVADVVAGRVVTGEWARAAVLRHVRDLEQGAGRGLVFDVTRAKMAVAFFGVLRHWKGEWAGQPVSLEPWQQFVIGSLFGWRRADGSRRFRTGYLEVARKNGKTTMAAGVGLYLLTADGEPGAEVYTAATKRDQSRIAHKDGTMMVKGSRPLGRMVKVYKDNLHVVETGSKFEPLAADYNSLDGLNVHGAICDEVHAWKGRELWDVLETATGARRQPLMFAITTAGYDRQSLCFQLHDYAVKVATGVVADDSFFGLVYGLDDGDDWEDEGNWGKANPNLNVSKKLDDMRRMAGRAREMPAQLNAFLRLHLNVWTQASSRWVNPAAWAACVGAVMGPGELEEMLAGRRCYGGLDLSSTTDVTAWVLVFEPLVAGGPLWVLPRFFLPEENLVERVRRDRVPYDVWVREGLLTLTPGNVVDYEFVLAQIDKDAMAFDVGEIAFDRWGATRVVTALMERGGEDWVVQFGQGFASMSPPMKELEKLILSQGIAHGGNGMLGWMADNLVARLDPAGNVKPDKEKSTEKIDGMVALIMGLDRVLRRGGKGPSVYEERGLRVL